MMDSIRIQIPDELFAPAESSHFEGEYKLEVLKAGPDLYTFEAPLAWEVDITNTGDALLVSGTVEGDARTSCARCLGAADVSLFGEVEGYFLITGGDAPEDMEDDEFDVLPEDETIDLVPLLNAALLVDVPLVPLCTEDCKGLCLTCGADLNKGDCACSEDPYADVDPLNPFAALKGLTFDED